MNSPIDDDYLWDRSGRDPEVERLERLLAPFGIRTRPAQGRSPMAGRRPRRRTLLFAAAAAVVGVALFGWIALQWRLMWPEGSAWALTATRGDVRLGDRAASLGEALGVGEELRTLGGAEAQFAVARIGQARLGPDSRLRIDLTRTGKHRVQLVEGRLWTRIWAPPRQFGVQLAGSEVVDLGCEFEVHAAPDGSGWIRVRSGWVVVETGALEVLVPAGARVKLAAGGSPSTPHDEGATAGFIAALRIVDAQGAGLRPDGEDVRRLLAEARPEDAISLLTLLGRVPSLVRGPVFDHLQAQWPDAEPVDRNAAARGDARALEPWWRALPYPRVKRWWVNWRDALSTGDPSWSSPDDGRQPQRPG